MDADTLIDPACRVPEGDDYLTRAALAELTPAVLTQRMVALQPTIANHAAETERRRHVADDVWSALRRSGYFYQFVPKLFGGMATDFDSFIDATLPIAEACASTAWAAGFCAGHNWIIAQFPLETQAELFGDKSPYVVAPLVSTPSEAVAVDNGIRVTGRWTWGTGIMHADWVLALALLPNPDGPPRMNLALFPAEDAEVLDTWYADGMAGSGSHDLRVKDLFVPQRRVLSDLGAIAGRGLAAQTYPEPVWRTPMTALNSLTACVAALGAARSALHAFHARLADRVLKGANDKQIEKPAAQLRLAEADLMVRNAEMLIRDAGRRAPTLGRVEEPEQTPQRIALRAQIAYAVSLCRKAALHLAEGAGSSVHLLDQPFQRAVRDLGLLSSHVGFDVDLAFELHGRAMVGLPPNSMIY